MDLSGRLILRVQHSLPKVDLRRTCERSLIRLIPLPLDKPTGLTIHKFGSAEGVTAVGGDAELPSTLSNKRERASRLAALELPAVRPRPKCSAKARYSFGRTKVGGYRGNVDKLSQENVLCHLR